ncbi:MAG: lipoyl domain-containing protein [Pseudomonadales bacterium]|nr:lipoyl domain-containing protein [Pseudomonadales bacterium]MBP7911481.1 lipoyl domain-containing protein [Pseudomonadales bacterium]
MSTTEGTLTEWLVEDGATVTAGQAIYALETDKSVQEIEAPESGRLIQKAAAGETYPVGTEIGEIVA